MSRFPKSVPSHVVKYPYLHDGEFIGMVHRRHYGKISYGTGTAVLCGRTWWTGYDVNGNRVTESNDKDRVYRAMIDNHEKAKAETDKVPAAYPCPMAVG